MALSQEQLTLWGNTSSHSDERLKYLRRHWSVLVLSNVVGNRVACPAEVFVWLLLFNFVEDPVSALRQTCSACHAEVFMW